MPGSIMRLEELVEGDLVEYEPREEAYYLSYEGFEVVKRLEEGEPEEAYARHPVQDEDDVAPLQSVADKLGGTKKFTRIVLGLIFLFGLAATLSALLGDDQPDTDSEILPDSTQVEMIREKADSVAAAENQ
ncbi:MAG: hypothetical protein WBB45_04945 [Cyclobacteriaceae bacterium]